MYLDERIRRKRKNKNSKMDNYKASVQYVKIGLMKLRYSAGIRHAENA